MQLILRSFAAVLLAVCVAFPVYSQSSDSASDGIKAFVEACIRGAPEFRSSEKRLRSRGVALVPGGRFTTETFRDSQPALHAYVGKAEGGNGATNCIVTIRGVETRKAVASVKAIVEAPDFTFKNGRRAGYRFFGNGTFTPSFSREYGLDDGRILVIAVGGIGTFVGSGYATVMIATTGKP